MLRFGIGNEVFNVMCVDFVIKTLSALLLPARMVAQNRFLPTDCPSNKITR